MTPHEISQALGSLHMELNRQRAPLGELGEDVARLVDGLDAVALAFGRLCLQEQWEREADADDGEQAGPPLPPAYTADPYDDHDGEQADGTYR